jgi:O-antigen ligase
MLILVSILIFINIKYPIIYDFFYQRLFSYFEKNGSTQIDLDQDSSEGYRVFMLKKVLNFVLFNPLTGAGFLGVWILFEDQSGSAHGQFVDVIFRTGIVGLLIYLTILFKLLKYFYAINIGYFWGIIGVIIYGFFHETFKLSQGSFILAFLIGYVSQYDKIKSFLIEK